MSKQEHEKELRSFWSNKCSLSSREVKILIEKGPTLFQFLFNKDYENVQLYLGFNEDLKEVIEKW